MTSVHPRHDTRIFTKECQSLKKGGFDVVLIVADGKGMETAGGVSIVDAGEAAKSPLGRIVTSFWRIFLAARRQHAALYHFHDPELIPAGILLKLSRKKVIFDVHEGLSAQIRSKHYIPSPLRPFVALAARAVEFLAAKSFDGFVAVNDEIASHFPSQRTIKVHNFPIISEIMGEARPYEERANEIVFIGVCSELRGLRQMIGAVNLLPDDLNAVLKIAGPIVPCSLAATIETDFDLSRVRLLGWQTREEIRGQLSLARAGLVVLHPEPNHINAMPNKLFDYMGVGLPVIASDFPQWRGILEDVGCGILVDPLSEQAIAAAIEHLLRNPKDAANMGQRGHVAATRKYNWEAEAARLVDFYSSILMV